MNEETNELLREIIRILGDIDFSQSKMLKALNEMGDQITRLQAAIEEGQED